MGSEIMRHLSNSMMKVSIEKRCASCETGGPDTCFTCIIPKIDELQGRNRISKKLGIEISAEAYYNYFEFVDLD